MTMADQLLQAVREVVTHEIHHQEEMNDGVLAYDDNSVTDEIANRTYTRENGYLIDDETGEVYEEGDDDLPHEQRAYKASNKIKNA